MTATASEIKRPVLWTAGDWNAFFGFGTNILVNMLVLTGLLRFVLKMPDSLVFGRILPALGLMMCLSTLYYAFLAYRLALKSGRSDVCALPSGVSVPHMFIVTFVIMLPISLKTNDPIKGWEAGLVWVFFQSFILIFRRIFFQTFDDDAFVNCRVHHANFVDAKFGDLFDDRF